MHLLLSKRIETPSWLVTLTIASLLAFFAGISCLILPYYLFARWVPIESLVAVLVFVVFTPSVFVLSIPYVIFARRILNRKGVPAGFRQFLTIFAVGSLIIVLSVTIIFPCDTPPYFVGAYLLEGLLGLFRL